MSPWGHEERCQGKKSIWRVTWAVTQHAALLRGVNDRTRGCARFPGWCHRATQVGAEPASSASSAREQRGASGALSSVAHSPW